MDEWLVLFCGVVAVACAFVAIAIHLLPPVDDDDVF
jgi:hypothetical protein